MSSSQSTDSAKLATAAAEDELQDVSLRDDNADERSPTRATAAAAGYTPWSAGDDDRDDGQDGWNERRHSDAGSSSPTHAYGRGLNVNQTDTTDNRDNDTANTRDDSTYEAVTLEDASRPSMNGEPVELDRGSTSPATTPPGSPSLSPSTAPTTVASVSLSSSQDVPSTANNQGSSEAGPSSPAETKASTVAAKVRATRAILPLISFGNCFYSLANQIWLHVQPTPQKKPSSSRTVMQQVISFTRQRNLPPKNREEEVRAARSSVTSTGNVC